MTRARITVRTAAAGEAEKLHALISANLEEGHLLPRTLEELTLRAPRFVVAVRVRRIIGCAELVPLTSDVAEIRSLVVDAAHRRNGVGAMILDELLRRAWLGRFKKLCAFTYAPAYFIPMGFSVVTHSSLPEKIWADCLRCAHFRHCGQYAIVAPLESVREVDAHAASLPQHAE